MEDCESVEKQDPPHTWDARSHFAHWHQESDCWDDRFDWHQESDCWDDGFDCQNNHLIPTDYINRNVETSMDKAMKQHEKKRQTHLGVLLQAITTQVLHYGRVTRG